MGWLRSALAGVVVAGSMVTGDLSGHGVAHAQELKIKCVVYFSDAATLTPEEFKAGVIDGSIDVVALEDSVECAILDGVQPTPASETPAPASTPLPPIIEGDEYDVCFLVEDAEIERVMHRRLMMGGFGTATGGIHNCSWSLYLDPLEMVMVTLSDASDFDLLTTGQPKIPGLGDEAAWVFDTMLYVRVGDQTINVMVMSETVDPKQASIDIARLAIPRLP